MAELVAAVMRFSPGWGILAFLIAVYVRYELQNRNGGTRSTQTLERIFEQARTQHTALMEAIRKQPEDYIGKVKEAYPVSQEESQRASLKTIVDGVARIEGKLEGL